MADNLIYKNLMHISAVVPTTGSVTDIERYTEIRDAHPALISGSNEFHPLVKRPDLFFQKASLVVMERSLQGMDSGKESKRLEINYLIQGYARCVIFARNRIRGEEYSDDIYQDVLDWITLACSFINFSSDFVDNETQEIKIAANYLVIGYLSHLDPLIIREMLTHFDFSRFIFDRKNFFIQIGRIQSIRQMMITSNSLDKEGKEGQLRFITVDLLNHDDGTGVSQKVLNAVQNSQVASQELKDQLTEIQKNLKGGPSSTPGSPTFTVMNEIGPTPQLSGPAGLFRKRYRL